ncbi:hypothetical protein TorRG33x02_210400 [Trema orientale]|uniref:Putative plant transposon protein domain-containing protein n=1 Tax=Trema orientale TaxID=63057 RepID=A0A2P5ECE4_TREOI|nr:hypothetical protein TorRG33x02_210400 [Trema orientale]
MSLGDLFNLIILTISPPFAHSIVPLLPLCFLSFVFVFYAASFIVTMVKTRGAVTPKKKRGSSSAMKTTAMKKKSNPPGSTSELAEKAQAEALKLPSPSPALVAPSIEPKPEVEAAPIPETVSSVLETSQAETDDVQASEKTAFGDEEEGGESGQSESDEPPPAPIATKVFEAPKIVSSKSKGHKFVVNPIPAVSSPVAIKSPKKKATVSKAIATKDAASESSIPEDVATIIIADPAAVVTKGKKIAKTSGSKSKKAQPSIATSPESISATSVKEVFASPTVAPTPKKSATTSETEEDPSMIPEEELSDIPEEYIPEDQDEEDSPEAIATKIATGYDISLAHSSVFYTAENEEYMDEYERRGFIDERNFNLDSFKPLGIVKILKERKWLKTVSKVEGYVPRIIQEFYCNIREEMADPESLFYHKIFLRGHVYDFNYQVIADYLDIPIVATDEYVKEYEVDKVVFELLGDLIEWPSHSSTLKSTDLTYKYSGLHKMAIHNWWPTAHLPTVARNFACFLFDIGTRIEVNLLQIIFQAIFYLRCGRKKTQRLIFPILIFMILQKQHPLQLPTEFLSPRPQSVNYRLKKKEVIEPIAPLLPSKSVKKKTAGKKSIATTSTPVATASSSPPQFAGSTDLAVLKADQAQQHERMEAMEKVQLKILAKLIVLVGSSVAATPPTSSSQPAAPVSPAVATDPDQPQPKKYKRSLT